VGFIKGVYNNLLQYFATRPDKLFIAITAPPLVESATSQSQGINARAVSTWLVNNWLSGYSNNNVGVFDLFDVLTSNGGNTNTNDADKGTGNHHRFRNNAIEYIIDQGSNYSQYGIGSTDSHPTSAGGQKSSIEYTPLLNIYYHRWKNG
jgi:hypothetical protein